MKFLREYRDPSAIKNFHKIIERTAFRPWVIMEICGGQTHNIVKFGLSQTLSKNIQLIHGPGCPVCVTPEHKIDAAVALSQRKNVVVCSFGDMLRVPGSNKSLLQTKTDGSDVRIIYSPLEALAIAENNPDKEIVFFAVGFETTAPANAMAIYLAMQKGITNFSMIVSHVLVPPAMEAILSNPNCKINGFLAAGHVCTIAGYNDYHEISIKHQIPIVVTGFEPVDILEGISRCVAMLESECIGVFNQYRRSVREHGNEQARQMLSEIFTTGDMYWRGIGLIPNSGFELSSKYAFFDAERRFELGASPLKSPSDCRAGEVLQGLLKPCDCQFFGNRCRPEQPMGAPMVSSEGACAAYYQYARPIRKERSKC